MATPYRNLSAIRFTLLLWIAAFLAGCNASSETTDSKPQSPLWSKYIAAHTSGVVSRHAKIRVLFVNPVTGKEAIGKNADGILEVSPSVKGAATFASEREIVITPTTELKPGVTYQVRVKARKLMALPDTLDTFQFAFQIIKPDYEAKVSGLSASTKNRREMILSGSLVTADVEDADKIEKMLDAKRADKNLKIDWRHLEDGRHHEFSIDRVARKDKNDSVQLAWNGAAIGVDKKGAQAVDVPALTVFKLTQIQAIHQAPQHVAVVFSDALDARQNLNGLVQTDQGQGRLRMEGNTLRIYPDKKFNGRTTVSLDRALRNDRGERLGQSLQQTVSFDGERPQVRFSGKGVILPDNTVLSIPFEGINVRSVQVTAFRVYDNNVGRFLQTNKLDGAEDIDRVGRFLWRKTIYLPTVSADAWTRYDLDATQLLKDNPGGLFRLTLSINRGNSAYACPEQDSRKAAEKEEPLANSEDLNVREASSWDYAEDYYGANGDKSSWAERENPCKDAYFKFAQGVRDARNYLASNIGLIAKRDQRGQVQVVATNLQTAQPLRGVSLKLMNYQDQLIAEGVTDREGFAALSPRGTPFYLVAEHNGQKGYLKANAGSSLPISHFDVGGEKVEAGIKGIIYGERGVWRPGDDMHLTFVLQDRDATIPATHPVTMNLFNPQGQLVQTVTNNKPVGGFYSFTLKTSDDAPTGNWTARAQLGGTSFAKTLKVETVMPNRLKVELELGKAALSAQDMPLNAGLAAQWLHGATAAGLKADVSLRFQPMPTSFGRYTDYVFDDPARQYHGEPHKLFDGELDSNGRARFEEDMPSGEAPGMLSAQFTARVFEEGGSFSSAFTSVPFYPYTRFVGIKLPKGDQARGMLLTDKLHSVSIATVDAQGNPASSAKVHVTVYKIQWKWWWDKTDESLAQYTKGEHTAPVTQSDIATKNGQGKFEFQIKNPEWGRYLVRACDTDSGHCTGKVFYIDWPAWAGRAREEAGAGANVLMFSSDKPKYQVGEVAAIQLPATTQGRALVTVENGTSVLERRWVLLSKNKTKFEVPVTAAMSPNVYVSVTLIQPHQGKDNDRPIRLYGVIPLEVQDPATLLTPQVKAADEWAPESSVAVEVSEAQGRAMVYTLAVVDEGLLGLTGFRTPSLHEHFYKKEALGVTTWDLFDSVAGAYGGELERLLALGGDETLADANKQTDQKRFPPVVQFFGPFELQANAVDKHELKLPQYIGAVRVMVVAGERNAYGSAAKSVFVRQPLSLLISMPRVIGPDEELSVPASLFVMEPAIKDVKLEVETDAQFETIGPDTVHVAFDKPGEKLGFLRLKARSKLGKATLRFTAVSGEHRSRSQITIDIRSPNPRTIEMVSKALEPGEAWEQRITPHGIAGTNEVVLEVSSLRPLNLERRLDYLVRYPHGCLEQTTSAVFPQLHLSSLVKLDEQRKAEIERNVSAGIEKLRQFQLANGAFAYWPGESGNFNGWANNYAGHFLVEADRLGHFVPPHMLSEWIANQKALAQAWQPHDGDSAMEQAYRLYTLAAANQPALGAMNRLREMTGLNPVVRWQLAAAYKLAGHREAAGELVRGLQADAAESDNADATFGSRLRDRAIILNSLIVLGELDRAAPLVKTISDELASQHWYSTQSTAYALMAMARLAGADKQSGTLAFEQKIGAAKMQKLSSDKPIYSAKLSGFPDAGEAVAVRNTSGKTLFVQVLTRGAAPVGSEKAVAAGLRMQVSYANSNGNPVDPGELQQGSDLVAKVTVTNTTSGRLSNIALSHIAPSGWELHNARLAATDIKAPEGIDYQDIRDDRVYSYFSLNAGETRAVEVGFNASYLGRYYLPGIAVEAMYDATKQARTSGQWVKVVNKAK